MTTGSELSEDERAEMRGILERMGAAPEVIEDLFADPTQSMPVGLLVHRGARFSAVDLARETGMELADIVEAYRLSGVPIADPAEVKFSPADVDFCRMQLVVADVMPASERHDLLRLIGTSLARIAEGVVTAWIQGVEGPLHETQTSVVESYRAIAVGLDLLDELRSMVAHLLNHHLASAIERQRTAQASVTTTLAYRSAVGFVDLVGFTALSRALSLDELAQIVRDFEARAFDVVTAVGGRVIKHVGDEVMFSAPTIDAGCAAAVGLLHGFADERVQPRGGLAYGELLTRGGDHYGPVVNLASRLADLAVPDELLCDEAFATGVGEGYLLEPAGRRLLKGFDEPVRVWSLTGK